MSSKVGDKLDVVEKPLSIFESPECETMIPNIAAVKSYCAHFTQTSGSIFRNSCRIYNLKRNITIMDY